MSAASMTAFVGALEAAAATHTPAVPASRVVFDLAPEGMAREYIVYMEAGGTGAQYRTYGGEATEADVYLVKCMADSAVAAIALRDTLTNALDRAHPTGTVQITVENPIPTRRVPNQTVFCAGVYMRVKHTRGS